MLVRCTRQLSKRDNDIKVRTIEMHDSWNFRTDVLFLSIHFRLSLGLTIAISCSQAWQVSMIPYRVWRVTRLCDATVAGYNSVISRFKIDLSPSSYGISFWYYCITQLNNPLTALRSFGGKLPRYHKAERYTKTTGPLPIIISKRENIRICFPEWRWTMACGIS